MKRIDVKGFIIPQEEAWIYDWLDYPYVTSDIVNKALKEANGDDVEVYINSYGGAVHVGSEIYTSLKDYNGNVLIKIVGLAASAASVVAMASKCLISPTAQVMAHNASTGSHGDYRVMDQTSEMLKKVNKSILNAYKLKTGLSEDKLKEIMDKETWMDAQEAVELGFADEIMFKNEDESNNAAPVLYNSLPMPGFKAIKEIKECGSIENFKKYITENKIKTTDNKVVENINNKKEDKAMDLNTLKNEHKDIYDEIIKNAKEEERTRIKAIEDLAIPGNEEIINKAKFETGATAESVAIEIIKNEKNKGKKFLDNRKTDITNSNLEDIKPSKDSIANKDDEEVINSIAKYANARRSK